MRFAIFFISLAAWAQLQPPQIGVMLDSAGAARPLCGVPASVTAGAPLETAVLSSACSGGICAFKTRSSLVVNGTRIAAPEGPAIFAWSPTSLFLYFPQTGQLEKWRDGNLTPLDLRVTGEILSLAAPTSVSLQFAVLRDGAISIVDQNDNMLAAIPGNGPVMLAGPNVVYADSGSLVLRRADQSELHWPLASIQAFSLLGDGYIQIRTPRASFALRIAAGREQLFELPETHR